MDKTPGKPNPMVPSGATDPLEDVQGKKKVGKTSDTKEYGVEMGPEETEVAEPGSMAGSEEDPRHVNTIGPDPGLVGALHGMKRNEEPK